MTRARSLSRLANTNAFTVDASNNVGIGSTIPDVRLDVNGDMNVTGTLTYEDVTNVETAGITTTGGLVVTGLGATIGGITTFFGDLNFGAAGVGGTITTLGHAEFAGVVTATSFSGDGSGLTGVASTDNINTSTLAQFTGGVGIADSIFHIGDDDTAIRFPANNTFTVETGGSERLRINSLGRVGIRTDPPNDMDGRLNIGLDGAVANTTAQVDVSDWGDDGYINLQNLNGTTTGSEVLLLSANAGGGGVASGIGFGRENSGNWGTYISFKTHSTSTSNLDELYERVRIDSSGVLLMGATASVGEGGTPADLNSTEVGRGYINLARDDTAAADHILFGKNGSVASSIGTDTTNTLVFKTGTTERLRIDSSGRLLQGKTATKGSTGENVPTYCTEIANTSNPNVLEIANNGTTSSSYSALALVRSDGTTVNSHTAVDSGDKIGEVCYIGADGADRFNTAAAIAAFANADFTANNCPANLVFYTNAGSASASERLRITAAGDVVIGTGSQTTPNTSNGNVSKNLQLKGSNNLLFSGICGVANRSVIIEGLHDGRSGNERFAQINIGTDGSDNGSITFYTAPYNNDVTARLQINHNGHVLPQADNSYDLGGTGNRWRNIYSADLQLSNEGSSNDVDGTWGQYTIQEGENDLFLLNRRNGKKYRFMLEEV